MFRVQDVLDLHGSTVALWHHQEIRNPYHGLLHVVCEQHKFNFLLWHEEDIARSPDVERRADRRSEAGHRPLQPAAQRLDRADRRVLDR